jgi:hypothetical protein
MADPRIFVFLVVVGLLCSVAGGYLTARMAKTAVLLNAAVMGMCSASVGFLVDHVSGASAPAWSQLALMASTVPVAMLGGLLGRPGRRRT